MFCPACGTQADETSRFCARCGGALPRGGEAASTGDSSDQGTSPADGPVGSGPGESEVPPVPSSAYPPPEGVAGPGGSPSFGQPQPSFSQPQAPYGQTVPPYGQPPQPPYGQPPQPPYGQPPQPSYGQPPQPSYGQPPQPPYGQPLPQYPAPQFGQPQQQWAMGAPMPSAPLAPFGAPLAGWWQRFGSLLLDILILVIPYAIINAIVRSATETTTPGGFHQANSAATAIVSILFILAQGFYFSRLNGTGSGQTLGNKAPGIAVRDVDTGAPIGARRGFVRWFVRVLLYVLVIPGLVNDLMPLWNPRRQTIADRVANSVMIRV